jgi:molecular chaperone GrpE
VTEDIKMKDEDIQQTDDVRGAESSTDQTQDTAAAGEALDPSAELEKLQAQANDYLNGWQRERAEFANYRKRVDREKEETFQFAAMTVLQKILPVIDDFERAMENTPEEIAEHSWTQGVSLIGGKFRTLLENSGLSEINPVGEPFDPAMHEAVGMDDSENIESGHITVVLQKGYAYGDKVLRPAMVRVAN